MNAKEFTDQITEKIAGKIMLRTVKECNGKPQEYKEAYVVGASAGIEVASTAILETLGTLLENESKEQINLAIQRFN